MHYQITNGIFCWYLNIGSIENKITDEITDENMPSENMSMISILLIIQSVI